jgi:hypothetical protein
MALASDPVLDHIIEPVRPLAVRLGDLTKDPANARLHPLVNITGITASLRVYGQRKPIVVNRGAVVFGRPLTRDGKPIPEMCSRTDQRGAGTPALNRSTRSSSLSPDGFARCAGGG